MLITTCASCAAPLPEKAKQCSRCKTRYCSAVCQRAHWKRGGHKDECEDIAEFGGAETDHALGNRLAAERDAMEACAADVPMDATCHICGGGPTTLEGLIRGCSCHGPVGFAHLRCLVDTATATLEAHQSWTSWTTCRLCKQEFHGTVRCALGWACWGSYVEAADAKIRAMAMTEVGIGLMEVGKDDEALRVLRASVVFQGHCCKNRSIISDEESANCLRTQCYLAKCCSRSGRQCLIPGGKDTQDGLSILNEAINWAYRNDLSPDVKHFLALGMAECLLAEHYVEAAWRLLAGQIVSAKRDLGNDDPIVIGLGFQTAQAGYKMHFFGRNDHRESLIYSIILHWGAHGRSARVLGEDHPLTRKIAAAFLKCFDEQLEWSSLDDIPSAVLAHRARLLGD